MSTPPKSLVLAHYPDLESAEEAAKDLRDWDTANNEVKLSAIGIITIDPKSGEMTVTEIGQSKTRTGALWGAAIGATTGILTAGVGLIPGLLVGAAAGGGLGTLNHKSLGMSDTDRDNLIQHLQRGGAALGVMADDIQTEDTKSQMVKEGGTVESYILSDEVRDAIRENLHEQTDAGVLKIKESLAEQFPWMSDSQIEGLLPFLFDTLAEHIREGGKVSAYYAATDREPARLVMLDIMAEADTDLEIEASEEGGK